MLCGKKYAYLSDYVRLWAVEKYGGIYLDTDVEVIRPLEKLLQEDAYFGFENKRYVNTGLGLWVHCAWNSNSGDAERI